MEQSKKIEKDLQELNQMKEMALITLEADYNKLLNGFSDIIPLNENITKVIFCDDGDGVIIKTINDDNILVRSNIKYDKETNSWLRFEKDSFSVSFGYRILETKSEDIEKYVENLKAYNYVANEFVKFKKGEKSFIDEIVLKLKELQKIRKIYYSSWVDKQNEINEEIKKYNEKLAEEFKTNQLKKFNIIRKDINEYKIIKVTQTHVTYVLNGVQEVKELIDVFVNKHLERIKLIP